MAVTTIIPGLSSHRVCKTHVSILVIDIYNSVMIEKIESRFSIQVQDGTVDGLS